MALLRADGILKRSPLCSPMLHSRISRPKTKPYKVSDRDGMYAYVSPGGSISFRFDYRMHNRRETLTLGGYSPAGLSLARAREKCIDARRALAEGRSPAQEKQRDKRRRLEAKSFGEFGERWLQRAPMADSTRAMRRAIFERELRPAWQKRLLTEILPDDFRAHCGKIVDRGAPATAIHVRDIMTQIYGFAILQGERVPRSAQRLPFDPGAAHPDCAQGLCGQFEVRFAVTLRCRRAHVPGYVQPGDVLGR